MSSDDSVLPLSEAVADYGGDNGAEEGEYSWSEGGGFEDKKENASERLAWDLQQRGSQDSAL